MIPFKLKTKSVSGKMTQIKSAHTGNYMKVCAVWYGGDNVGHYVMLFDADGDMFIFPIPGQDPRGNRVIVYPDVATPVKLPISYLDEDIDGGNDIIIWGEVYSKPAKPIKLVFP